MEVKPFKIILVGDRNVGKSAFISKYKDNIFRQEYIPTDGCEIYDITIFDDTISIWDIGNCQMDACYYMNSDMVIIMFDLTNIESYRNIYNYYKEVKRVCEDNVPIILVGNKFDCRNNIIVNRINMKNMMYFNISVKTGFNIDNVITYMLKLKLNFLSRITE